jgi:hypothetical protein
MEAFSPPHPTIDLSTPLYYQLVYTLTGLLPRRSMTRQKACAPETMPPSPRWRRCPVDANEADLAARCEENVSENETNSQKTAFETWMSAIPWNGVSKGSGKTGPRDVVREATARSCLVGRESPANGREPPERRTKAMPNIDRSTGPANTGAQSAR